MYCSWLRLTHGDSSAAPRGVGVRRSALERQLKDEMDAETKKSAESQKCPRNVNPPTWALKCVCREDKLCCRPRPQMCSVSFSRIQRIRFLFNCVASREATNSSRGFHSIQSFPRRPPGLYYILIHSQRKGKIPLTGNFHLSPTATTTMMPWSHGRFISQQKTKKQVWTLRLRQFVLVCFFLLYLWREGGGVTKWEI